MVSATKRLFICYACVLPAETDTWLILLKEVSCFFSRSRLNPSIMHHEPPSPESRTKAMMHIKGKKYPSHCTNVKTTMMFLKDIQKKKKSLTFQAENSFTWKEVLEGFPVSQSACIICIVSPALDIKIVTDVRTYMQNFEFQGENLFFFPSIQRKIPVLLLT